MSSEEYNYGYAFTAQRDGKLVFMYKHLALVDILSFDSEEEAHLQMESWRKLGESFQASKDS